MANPAKLDVRDVSVTFDGRHTRTVALSNINLAIENGEFVCLLGKSGCGKSSLLHLMAGLLSPSSGTVLMDGLPVKGPSATRAMVFQSPALLPWLSVERNVRLGLEIQRKRDRALQRVQDLLLLVGLTGFERHRPRELSGGMAQRVAIARALVCDPEVVLLDEPFGALDTFTRMRLQDELIRTWTERRYTAVFVTHDVEEAVYLATRIILLTPRPGRIARVLHNDLRRPRDRNSVELFRLRQMISQEFVILEEDAMAESLRQSNSAQIETNAASIGD